MQVMQHMLKLHQDLNRHLPEEILNLETHTFAEERNSELKQGL
jgi:hypothetical protein